MAPPLTLLTWNVLGLRRWRDARAVVRAAGPDVACLQECPRWPGGRAALMLFARQVGMRVAAGGGRCGVAVLISERMVVESAGVSAMPRRRTRWWWSYPRATASAHLWTSGRSLSVASVHLDVQEAGRLAHAQRVLDDLASDDEASIVAGDLNEAPDGASWSLLTSRLRDTAGPAAGPTYPATPSRRPNKRIDAVLASPGVAVTGYRTGADRQPPPSDHLPVLVRLTLPDLAADGVAAAAR